jgi:catecholate siderophore receptor
MSKDRGNRTAQLLWLRLGCVSAAALLVVGSSKLLAQPAPAAGEQLAASQPASISETAPARRPSTTTLPTVSVQAPRQAPQRRTQRTTATRTPLPAAPVTAATAPIVTQDTRAGVSGYSATRSTTATKTDTPLINVPQSVTVLTKEFIRDQNFQSLTEALRYAPGVIPHQGEFNRDQVVIRGQSSSADFYVDGFRDDVQYFRDLYNINRIEVLKGPNAMIFGRGGGGGIINRVLKEADGVPVRELTLQGGQFNSKRGAIDLGQAVNDDLAVRFNSVYENSDSYRKFVNIERFGINPTATYKPNDSTTIKLSYEYFHDNRTSDRGIPSQAVAGVTPGPGNPLFPYKTDPSTFFGNPNLNFARVDAHIATAVIEHDFDSGLKVRNATRYATYDKMYQNIFPGSAVNPAGTSVSLSAYNNETDRQNLINQTDFTYKLDAGWTRHTFLVGTEVGRQSGLSFRQDGFFNGTSTTIAVSPLNPVNFTPVVFRNIATGANNTYTLGTAGAYAQDQVEITKYLQLIGGVRFDRFDLDSTDRRTGVTLSRTDDLVSPRFGVVLKPVENVSIYGSYSVSYLPSSGDQFSTLSPGTVIAEPEKFLNREIGLKWDIFPRLQFSTAVYDLDRSNQRLADPNNPGFFILSGKTNAKGVEAGLTGFVTDAWQVSGGYAYTDARIVSATSTTIVAGNHVALVPFDTFTLWNKYQLTELWAVGAGIIHQTSSFAASDDTVKLPGFTRVDAAVFGKVDPRWLPTQVRSMRWQINVENVFNERYYATADSNNNITPGSSRAVRGSLIANF